MIESLVRLESWITEVVRINSSFRRITELEFGYLQLGDISHKPYGWHEK
ncbi:MAG: hypothetical protein ISS94_00335 [Candidatus Syntrophoarchaeum sp.]|nr:hypothetical protein [Candidatus Syntrophoarchaeum sp.]